MNRKILKVFFILLLVLVLFVPYVHATDVDLNLPSSTNETGSDFSTSTPTENLQPSGMSTSAQTELGITNIINILLITVGVILILLGIAILIRLRG